MNRLHLIDLPGLSRELLAHIPPTSALGKWISAQPIAGLTPSWPALTCSIQATLTTGVSPDVHGIIANGLPTFRFPQDQALVDASNFPDYRRDLSFWEQSNQFLQAPRFWQKLNIKTALLFFQHSMPGFAGELKPAADIVITPKPEHGPDGKITSLLWTQPTDLVPRLFKDLGPFPLMNYWGPMANIASSKWIAQAAAYVWQHEQPTLQMTYIPHLDYDLQRFGPDSEQARKAVIDLAEALEPLVTATLASGGKLVLLSEYAIKSVSRSVAPNRLLAQAGLLVTRDSADGKLIDYKNSPVFAMVDHQIAHVYVNDRSKLQRIKEILQPAGNELARINHPRAGDIQLTAASETWLDYRWWLNDADAPTFAKMVDIHRKPGYDPLELFFDPATRSITQNASLIRGSHGAVSPDEAILIGIDGKTQYDATQVADALVQQL